MVFVYFFHFLCVLDFFNGISHFPFKGLYHFYKAILRSFFLCFICVGCHIVLDVECILTLSNTHAFFYLMQMVLVSLQACDLFFQLVQTVLVFLRASLLMIVSWDALSLGTAVLAVDVWPG